MKETPDLDTFIQQITWNKDARLHGLSTNEEPIFTSIRMDGHYFPTREYVADR
jgi:hypothetical protein